MHPSQSETTAELKSHLEIMRDCRKGCAGFSDLHYSGMEDAILQEGMYACGIPVLPEWLSAGRRGYCYQTALRAATNHDHLRYVEGYGLFMGVPMHHAWVYDMVTGCFYDPTWDRDGTEYYGVVFDTEFVLSFSFRSERYGIWGSERYDLLAGYMENGFPEFAILQFGDNEHRRNNTDRKEGYQDDTVPAR